MKTRTLAVHLWDGWWACELWRVLSGIRYQYQVSVKAKVLAEATAADASTSGLTFCPQCFLPVYKEQGSDHIAWLVCWPCMKCNKLPSLAGLRLLSCILICLPCVVLCVHFRIPRGWCVTVWLLQPRVRGKLLLSMQQRVLSRRSTAGHRGVPEGTGGAFHHLRVR